MRGAVGFEVNGLLEENEEEGDYLNEALMADRSEGSNIESDMDGINECSLSKRIGTMASIMFDNFELMK